MPFRLSGALIRRNALYKGVFGTSNLWQVVALFVFGRTLLKKTFGRQPDMLGTEVLKPGQFVRIEAIAPPSRPSRRSRRRARRAAR